MGREEWIGTDREIQILISTDVLSEGHNLQDCGHLLNYDLHWNPTRMVQRAGRIDRIGTDFETLWIYNMFPDAGLERLLRLVESLSNKIAHIDRAGFHDASILGEVVHPRDFNTLRRIRDEDDSVIEEEEQFFELTGAEAMTQTLREMLEAGGKERLEDLPDGIHSGLLRTGAQGAFFYFQADTGTDRQHFWRYVDLREETMMDNRQMIAGLIACRPETQRVIDPTIWMQIFQLQERVIEDILGSVRQKAAMEAVPKALDPIQQTVATAIQTRLDDPAVQRDRAVAAIRFLSQPMVRVNLKELRRAFREFQRGASIESLLASVEAMRDTGEPVASDGPLTNRGDAGAPLSRDQLRLICFDLVTGG